MVSLDTNAVTLLSNSQIEASFAIRSSDPKALEIVSKVANAMSAVTFCTRYPSKNMISVRIKVTDPEYFAINHPFIKDFYAALRSEINGSERMRARRNGTLVI